jgi:pyruvate/2-oxoglutarate dehydrogenase complex dihydrolipoamide acyltransferase (E2) component
MVYLVCELQYKHELGRLNQVLNPGTHPRHCRTINDTVVRTPTEVYVAPVIVPTEVAILGVGKSRTVPVFDEDGQVTRGDMGDLSNLPEI